MRIEALVFRSILFLLAVIVFLPGCSKKKVNGDMQSQEPQEAPAAMKNVGMPQQKPIPPNTALVSALLESWTERDDHYLCQLKIESVHGYGAATKPLATGTNLEAVLPKTLVKNEKTLNNNTVMQLSLSYQQMLEDGEARSGHWMIIQMR